MGKRIDTVINPYGEDMGKFGHIELSVTEAELREVFDFGDVLKVTIGGIGSFVMPFFYYYDEVGIGELVLCTHAKHTTAVIARNYRSFGIETGLLEPDTQNGNFHFKNCAENPIPVTLELERKGQKSNLFLQDSRNNFERGIYDFRMIGGTPIRSGVLFRSSSPIDSRLTDCKTADRKAKEAGIRSIINLANTRREAEGFPDFFKTYCSRCKIAYINMPLNVLSEAFQHSIRKGFEFIADNEPPFLIFCSEGRDRTGLFVALLQCLCGVGLSDILSDYVFSFQLVCDDGRKNDVLHNAEQTLLHNICSILDCKKISQSTLATGTAMFLHSIGIKEETILAVRNKCCRVPIIS